MLSDTVILSRIFYRAGGVTTIFQLRQRYSITANLRRGGPSSSPPSRRHHTAGSSMSPSVAGVLGGRRKVTSVGTGGDTPSHSRPHFYSPFIGTTPPPNDDINASHASILPPPTSSMMVRSAYASSTASPASTTRTKAAVYLQQLQKWVDNCKRR